MSDLVGTLLFGASYWVGSIHGFEIALVFWVLGLCTITNVTKV